MSNKIYDTVTVTLGSSVAIGATFTASYPAGKGADDYRGGDDHLLISNSAPALFFREGDFDIAFGASNMTVSILRGRGFTAGSVVNLNLDRAAIGPGEEVVMASPEKMAGLTLIRVNLGTPIASAANNIIVSQDLTSAGVFSVSTTAAAAIAAAATGGVLDVPRALVAAWTGTAVLTVTGTDEYGNVVRESSASGTSFAGKKAFKTITDVSVSANVTSLTVGTGKVLGLPVFLTEASEILREIVAGSVVTNANGTFVVGDAAAATATTGDVRGTYAPNGSPDGTTLYEAILAVRSPEYRGQTQFAG